MTLTGLTRSLGGSPGAPHATTSVKTPLSERVGLLPVKRRGLTDKGLKELYRHPESFVDLLQCAQYLPEHGVFALNDAGESVAALFELRPVDVAGRPPDYLIDVRDRIVQALTILPEHDDSPWIVQWFVQDEPLTALALRVRHYAGTFAHDRPAFRDAYCRELERHFHVLARRGGLFVDRRTGARWGGRYRRVRLVLYRMTPSRRRGAGVAPETELNDVATRLMAGLEAAGVQGRRCRGGDYYEWMMPWLNPRPDGKDSAYALLMDQPYPGELDAGNSDDAEALDLGEAVLKRYPVAELDTGFWWFSGLPHTAVSIDRYFRLPNIGHWTLEREHGQQHAVLMDQLPEGSVVGTTVVIAPQDEQELKVETIERASVGGSARARRCAEDAQQAMGHLADGRKLYPAAIQVFLRAETPEELCATRTRTLTALRAANLDPIESSGDSVALDTYARYLPMAYQAGYDTALYRNRGMWDQHLVNLLPVFGSGVGTGSPGLVFSNPAGEPLLLDPLNEADREMNAHALILGPTGSGKSALLNTMIASMLAVHDPYVVIIDVGGSFKLLGDYLARHGYTVNQIKLTPDAEVSMPPFAEGLRALDQYYGDHASDKAPEDQRDILSEMEIAARYMITGGVPTEEARFRREDIMTVRHALFRAAANVRGAGRDQVMVEDVVTAMRELAEGATFVHSNQTLNTDRRQRASQMADAMNVFSTGVGARFFNRPGALWPESDVTIVDLGHLARDGYQDALIMTYIGLMNRINEDIERRRGGTRQTLIVNDEAHITTTNPLLARYVVKAAKMWRKLGTWLWMATQNLRDFPNESATILNMAEWWFCLSMPNEEVEQIARFQKLEDEERSMLISARKEPGRFIEGVILSKRVRTMFRNVPPALYLALAQTEQQEYARRRRLMREHGIDELAAAEMIAKELDEQRCAT